MSDSVEKIKARLNIEEVVSSYLKLEKAGGNFRARCPFHNEKTPSFFVSPARDSYHCFGCNRGGDIFSFVQEIEGLDFVGALKVLAARAGVALETKTGEVAATSDKAKLVAVLEAATNYFAEELKRRPTVTDYLSKRGVTESTIKNFRLGFAPEAWSGLIQALGARGFTPEMLERAGLAIRGTKPGGAPFYDRFRNRMMFPLGDATGRLAGFSGRIFGESNSNPSGIEVAKYINTPETVLYDKSRILFGYDRARLPIRRADRAVLVEGQFDLVLSHQAGVDNAVAVSGTALTREHLRLVKRLTLNLVMAFDSDPAGLKASQKAINLALSEGFEVLVAELPEGSDPAELVLRDPESWTRAVNEAKPVIDFYLGVFGRREPDSRRRAHLFKKEIYPALAALTNRIDAAHFIKKVAEDLGLSESLVAADLAEIKLNPEVEGISLGNQPAVSETLVKNRLEKIEEKLLGFWFWQESLPAPTFDLNAFKNKLIGFLSVDYWQKIYDQSQKKKNPLILETEIAYAGSARLEAEAEELLLNWRLEKLKQELAEALRALKLAERDGNSGMVDNWLLKCQDISRQINDIQQ